MCENKKTSKWSNLIIKRRAEQTNARFTDYLHVEGATARFSPFYRQFPKTTSGLWIIRVTAH